jgi:hypothetical protein
MAVDMTPIAIVEREPKLEGKNMFMILAPRAVPTGPPKFLSQYDKHDKHEDEHPADDAEAETKEPTSA